MAVTHHDLDPHGHLHYIWPECLITILLDTRRLPGQRIQYMRIRQITLSGNGRPCSELYILSTFTF